jgi:phosphodiesterase/alkaline phosphatase D-like protein
VFEAAAAAMPAVRYVDARRRGYVVCEITADDLTAEFRYVASTATPEAEVATGARWVIAAGDPEPRAA